MSSPGQFSLLVLVLTNRWSRNFSTIDSLKENYSITLCVCWQTWIKESQPLFDARAPFIALRIWQWLETCPPLWICRGLPGVLGEFSQQALQVMIAEDV